MKHIVFFLLLIHCFTFAVDSNEVIIEKLKKSDETITLSVYNDVSQSIKNDKLQFSEVRAKILILMQYNDQSEKAIDELFIMVDSLNNIYKSDDEHFEIMTWLNSLALNTVKYDDKTYKVCIEYKELLLKKRERLLLIDESNNLGIARCYIEKKDYKSATTVLNGILNTRNKYIGTLSRDGQERYSIIRCKALDELISITPEDKIKYLRLSSKYGPYIMEMNYYGYDKELFKDTFIDVDSLTMVFNWLSGEYLKTDSQNGKKIILECLKMVANKDPMLLKVYNSFNIDYKK